MTVDEVVAKPPGTWVRRDEILVESWPHAAAAPIAPADGRVNGLTTIHLAPDFTTAAVLFKPDADAPLPEPLPPATASALEPMLGRLREVEWPVALERLRRAGIWSDRWTTPDLLGQLRACARKPIHTLLCDGLDESPDLLLHNQVLAAYPVEVTAGLLALAALVKAEQVLAVLAAYGDPHLRCHAPRVSGHAHQARFPGRSLSAVASNAADP